MMKAIDNWDYIYTGSNNGYWYWVYKTHIYSIKPKKTAWHLFCIIGYNGDWFIAVNSYGKKDGYFVIPYDLVNTLYTRYAVLNDDKEEYLLLFKTKLLMKTVAENVKTLVDLWITNGERLNEKASREEVLVLVARMYDKIIEKVNRLFEIK